MLLLVEHRSAFFLTGSEMFMDENVTKRHGLDTQTCCQQSRCKNGYPDCMTVSDERSAFFLTEPEMFMDGRVTKRL